MELIKMFGLCLPSHQIRIVKDDGKKQSIMCADCSTKQEVRKEAGEWISKAIEYQVKQRKTEFESWKEIEYINDRTDEVLYTCSIEECLKEIDY